ncbi:MAG: hypothetical protein HY692_06350 [Cyanobacteria bacterium NC_groundwater_1444_Ag_S-0.65um_54_12]|nr:hypothetical protein [Cyanobacteria bacterium NC_groundwater_1444_Ag_S-0.65um_54_12]
MVFALKAEFDLQIMSGTAEAQLAFGDAVAQGLEDIDEWAHAAEQDLGEFFEVVWSGSAQEDIVMLDRLAKEWSGQPDDELLYRIALMWGALIGERVIEAVGGNWIYRTNPLHHSLRFVRQNVEFFPMHAVIARFLPEMSGNLEEIYHQLVEYLTEN